MVRPVLIAVAALLALIVGTWLAGVWPGRSPRGPRDLQPPARVTEGPKGPKPAPALEPRQKSVENASVSSRTETLAPETPPTEIVTPPPDPPAVVTKVPGRPDVSAAGKQAGRLEQLRTQARTLRQAGEREQALNVVGQGLQIAPKDTALRTMRDAMLTEAQAGAARARRDAVALDAGERAGEAFGQGRAHERAAERLRRTGRIEDATRSFWEAADEFRVAAAESSRIAREEAAAAAALTNKPAKESATVQPPRAPIQPDTKPVVVPTLAENVVAANETLRRFETAYATLRVDAVRKVYPQAPIDELEKDFAGATSCTVKIVIDGSFRFTAGPSFSGLASAAGRITKTIVKKSGAMPPDEREVTILLEKPGDVWIITRIR